MAYKIKLFCIVSTLLVTPLFQAQAAPLDIREVSDRIGIEETITKLFIKTDEKDWAAVQGVFAPSVKFDMSSLTGAAQTTLTPQAITAIWEKGLKPIPVIHHQAGNFRFQVDGDSAEAHCYGIAFHYRPVASHHNTRTFVGSYDFHLLRADHTWKIDSFRYNSQFVDGNLKLDTAK